jgi:hypothetical protein
MKKQILAVILGSTLLIPVLHAKWQGTQPIPTPVVIKHNVAAIKTQDIKRQCEQLISKITSAFSCDSIKPIIPLFIAALENFGNLMPEIMEAAQADGTEVAIRAHMRQLAHLAHRMCDAYKPNRDQICKKMVATIYATHPPARAQEAEHAPCHKILELDWQPGAIVGLYEYYVDGTPHAPNLITFCSKCMASLKKLLDDAAQRKQECNQLENALWQFEQQLER